MDHVPCRCASVPHTMLLMISSSFMPSCVLWDLLYHLVPFSLVLRDRFYWSVNIRYNLVLTSYIFRLLPKKVFVLSFHLNASISNSAYDWLLFLLVRPEVPNPELFHLWMLARGRCSWSILVGRSWWFF